LQIEFAVFTFALSPAETQQVTAFLFTSIASLIGDAAQGLGAAAPVRSQLQTSSRSQACIPWRAMRPSTIP